MRHAPFAFSLVLLLSACADSTEIEPDVETDVEDLDTADGAGDAVSPDAEQDAQPDAAQDADAGQDTDVSEDAAPDVPEPDVAPDTLPDTDVNDDADQDADDASDTAPDTTEPDGVEGPVTRYLVDDDAPSGGDGLTWDTAFDTLAEGLSAANESEEARVEVWVAAGIYRPGDSLHPAEWEAATFSFGAGVVVYGGFAGDEDPATFDVSLRNLSANLTTLSGDNAGDDEGDVFTRLDLGRCFEATRPVADLCATWDHNEDGFFDFADLRADPRWQDNSRRVVTIEGGDEHTLLDGFTITGGVAIDEDTSDSLNSGAGIWARASRAEISNVNVFANFARIQGGGLYAQGTSDTRGFVLVRDAVLQYNHAETGGGGASAVRARLRTRDVTFFGNTTGESIGGGGAVTVSDGGTLQAFGTRFIGNTTHATLGNGGGAIRSNETLLFDTCVFNGNSAPSTTGDGGHGGALLIRGGRVQIINSTFHKNAANEAGAMEIDSSTARVTVENSIFWGNEHNSTFDPAKEIQRQSGSLTISRSIVELSEEDGVSLDDPQFIDPLGDDRRPGTLDDNLRLFPTSPAVDAGDTTALPEDIADRDNDGDEDEPSPLDLDGLARVIDIASAADTGTPADAGGPVVDLGAYERQGE